MKITLLSSFSSPQFPTPLFQTFCTPRSILPASNTSHCISPPFCFSNLQFPYTSSQVPVFSVAAEFLFNLKVAAPTHPVPWERCLAGNRKFLHYSKFLYFQTTPMAYQMVLLRVLLLQFCCYLLWLLPFLCFSSLKNGQILNWLNTLLHIPKLYWTMTMNFKI